MIVVRDAYTELVQRVRAGTLSHALVVYGDNLLEQERVVRRFAQYLEQKEKQVALPIGQSPLVDAYIVSGQEQDLGVEVARAFSGFLYQHPIVSAYRLLGILHGEELTDQAQNALLKITEDPPEHAVIIIALRDSSVLLPALASRLEKIFVGSGSGTPEAGEARRAAREYARRFLEGTQKDRSALIKELVEHDGEDAVEKQNKIVDTVVEELILELAQRPEAHSALLKELLRRQTAMRDQITNKRLQLEAASQLIKSY